MRYIKKKECGLTQPWPTQPVFGGSNRSWEACQHRDFAFSYACMKSIIYYGFSVSIRVFLFHSNKKNMITTRTRERIIQCLHFFTHTMLKFFYLYNAWIFLLFISTKRKHCRSPVVKNVNGAKFADCNSIIVYESNWNWISINFVKYLRLRRLPIY